jgi:hypothetical protein
MKSLAILLIVGIFLQTNIYALSSLSELSILSFDDEGSNTPPIVIESTYSSRIITHKYIDGSSLELYPNLIEVYKNNGISVRMNWAHRSAENEWWCQFFIGSLTCELFTHNRLVDAFFPLEATDDHLELIVNWVAMFPGFEQSKVEFHSGLLIPY